METFSIAQTTKERIPNIPFARLKELTLGKKFNCSLAFVGDKRAQTLNRIYRNKEYIPNTLSFTLDDENGEVFINLKEAKKQCKQREESYEYYVALLFVHSCLHLKGMEHSDIMDQTMEKILARAGIKNSFSAIA
ncbi:MAG TPA: rRNA maturation RNase YbeY [Candidatus Paceibacterota bacterium]|nr:rRNA maturation RNase YbeY [Candidatus Paceibacterota bacterium]